LKFERKVLAFYYVWYATPWGSGGKWSHWGETVATHLFKPEKIVNGIRDVAATNYPLDGIYDSLDDCTIRRHINQAKEAGIDGFILSWWDGWDWAPEEERELLLKPQIKEAKKRGLSEEQIKAQIDTVKIMADYSEKVLDKCLKFCPRDFGFTIYYETAMTFPLRDKKRELALNKIYRDLKMVLEKHSESESWIKIDGKPLLVLYIVENYTVKEWTGIKEKLKADGFNPFFLGDTYKPEYLEVMDGLHTYNPIWITLKGLNPTKVFCEVSSEAHKKGKLFAATVCPGYDDRKIRDPGVLIPRENGYYYRSLWEAARESQADWVLVTSWNEWHEGSEIEPSLQYGKDYIYLTGQQAKAFKSMKK